MNKKEQHALKGKHRESGKIKGLFNASIPSVVGNKGGGLNSLITPQEFSDDPIIPTFASDSHNRGASRLQAEIRPS